MSNTDPRDHEVLTSTHLVRSYELDSFGHVNNANFLNYLEAARCDFLLAKGLGFQDFHTWKRFPLVTKATLEYKFPAVSDDRLLIKGWVSKHTATSFTLQYEIINESNQKLVLLAETVHVFVNGENNRPARIPEPFKNKFILGID